MGLIPFKKKKQGAAAYGAEKAFHNAGSTAQVKLQVMSQKENARIEAEERLKSLQILVADLAEKSRTRLILSNPVYTPPKALLKKHEDKWIASAHKSDEFISSQLTVGIETYEIKLYPGKDRFFFAHKDGDAPHPLDEKVFKRVPQKPKDVISAVATLAGYHYTGQAQNIDSALQDVNREHSTPRFTVGLKLKL